MTINNLLFYCRSEVIAIVRMSGSTAINVAKLQEQLAKNVTIYNTGSGINSNTGINSGTNTGTNSGNGNTAINTSGSGQIDHASTADNSDSVSITNNLYR